MSVRRGSVLVTFDDLYDVLLGIGKEDDDGHVLAVEVDNLSRTLTVSYFNRAGRVYLDGSQAPTDRWPR